MSGSIEPPPGTVASVGHSAVGADASVRASRIGWDRMADDYQSEHAEHLGAGGGGAEFVWGPEGLREAEVRLLGAVEGKRVLEVGCGAAQCSRWLSSQGAVAVGIDLSAGMLAHSRSLDAALAGGRTPVAQADARALPFTSGSFDTAFTSYGALPFVADPGTVHREVARVLRPRGRWVFSVTHPFRWVFPDDPGPEGLTVTGSYFDQTPYVERDETGQAVYVEHHTTIGGQVRALTAAGFVLDDLVEPTWPPGQTQSWGAWSPLRGALVPGTAIYRCTKG